MSKSRALAKLTDLAQEVHAQKTEALETLVALIETAPDPELRSALERHRDETERHRASIEGRLLALGGDRSTYRETRSLLAAAAKGFTEASRTDATKNLIDAYVQEQREIATYELLERVASRAGDTDTVEVARTSRLEDEAMAATIASSWDGLVDALLAETGP